jgi:hypothetical protein
MSFRKSFGSPKDDKKNGSRILEVEVVEARNLQSMVKNKASADSYVTASLLDLSGVREISNETFKTKIKSDSLNPKWAENFNFGNNYNIDNNDGLPNIRFNVNHKTTFSISESPMGSAIISLDDIKAVGTDWHDEWYPLKG